MKTFLFGAATMFPFLIYMAVVPPERRALPRRLGTALLCAVAIGIAGYGAYRLHAGDLRVGRVWIGLAMVALALAFARWRGWVGPRDGELY